jgi:hypothetical protein
VTGFRLPGGSASVTADYPALRAEIVPEAPADERPLRVSGLSG